MKQNNLNHFLQA